MAKDIDKEDGRCFKNLLKTIDSLDMQINRIKNQLTELRLMIGKDDERDSTFVELLNDRD